MSIYMAILFTITSSLWMRGIIPHPLRYLFARVDSGGRETELFDYKNKYKFEDIFQNTQQTLDDIFSVVSLLIFFQS